MQPSSAVKTLRQPNLSCIAGTYVGCARVARTPSQRRGWLLLLNLAFLGLPACSPSPLSFSPTRSAHPPETLSEALSPKHERHLFELARLNLLCAESLPGGEKIDLLAVEQTLGTWARRVASETERYFHEFRRDPAEYHNSEPYFRLSVLITVLQQDFGVHYNPTQVESPDFSDSRNLFLNGLLGPERHTKQNKHGSQ